MDFVVYTKEGKDSGKKISLPESFTSATLNDHCIYLDVKQYLANQRQGTHKSKERAEVSYSTKKIKKQKGTGGARAGSIKSPVFVGGGRIFGPRPRDYEFKLNKKVKKLARLSAVNYKLKENQVVFLEDFNFQQPKTKEFSKLLSNLNTGVGKVLVLASEGDNLLNIHLSARNLPLAKVLPVNEINTYDVLNAKKLVIVDKAVPKLIELLS